MSEKAIKVGNMSKRYGSLIVVDKVSFSVQQGEFVSLLGPSGCGKTTTLRIIAGFVAATDGVIEIHGKNMTHLPPEKRGVGFVFQNYALWPHMSVADNIAFGLKLRRKNRHIIKNKIEEVLEITGLSGYETRLPRQLSGGQQQRVALARALALEPSLLLMDEPLSNLDRALRVTMRRELKELQARIKMTTLYVTHDQEEALSMSDRVVVMKGGRVEQIATPFELYEHPATTFVADFVGITNFLTGKIVGKATNMPSSTKHKGEEEEYYHIHLISGATVQAKASGMLNPGQIVNLTIRPERLNLSTNPITGDNVLQGMVCAAEYFGATVRYKLRLEQGILLHAEMHNFEHFIANGTPVWIKIDPDYLRLVTDGGER